MLVVVTVKVSDVKTAVSSIYYALVDTFKLALMSTL